jgi:phosphate transport system substrate-binding protein
VDAVHSEQPTLSAEHPRGSSASQKATILTTTKMKTAAAFAMVSLLATLPVQAQMVTVDADIKPYEKTSGVTGNLNSIGSDTLNNLMTLWAEGFKAQYPNVNIQIEGKGSSTAPPALIEGTAQLGPMSREMKSTEIDAFEKKYGYKPTEIRVAVDSLAVFTHKDNPIAGLTMKQVDSIFSSTFKAGGKDIVKWGDLGLTGEWGNKALSLYGRNSASGTYGYFKEHGLAKGDFKATVKEQPGSSSVVQGVGSDLAGIGYAGIGYKTSEVRALPLAVGEGGKFVEPTYENCLSGDYPIARFLYVYINKKPGAPADKLVQEFIKFVESKEGQQVVVKDGYFPLPAALSTEEIAKISN